MVGMRPSETTSAPERRHRDDLRERRRAAARNRAGHRLAAALHSMPGRGRRLELARATAEHYGRPEAVGTIYRALCLRDLPTMPRRVRTRVERALRHAGPADVPMLAFGKRGEPGRTFVDVIGDERHLHGPLQAPPPLWAIVDRALESILTSQTETGRNVDAPPPAPLTLRDLAHGTLTAAPHGPTAAGVMLAAA